MFFETKNLCFSYYKSPLCLKDVNFSFDKNSKFLILASKDSGKTTILKVLSGFEDSRFGNIYLNGKELKEISDKDKNFSLLPSEPILFENKTIKQNLNYQIEISELKGYDDSKLNEILNDFGFNIDLNIKVKKLSLLNKRKLQLIRAIIKKPQILFLDDQFEEISDNDFNQMIGIYNKLLINKELSVVFTLSDESYKKIKEQIYSEKINRVLHLNLAEITEFNSFKDFENSYQSLDVLKFLDNKNIYFRQIEKEDKIYTLINDEKIQFQFDTQFNKQLDGLKLEFAEIEDCVIVLKNDRNLDDINEFEFNKLLKSNQCIIFSKLTEKRVI